MLLQAVSGAREVVSPADIIGLATLLGILVTAAGTVALAVPPVAWPNLPWTKRRSPGKPWSFSGKSFEESRTS